MAECERLVAGQPCGKLCSPSEKYCNSHRQTKTNRKDPNYSIQLFSDEVHAKKDSEQFSSLKMEVAMLRTLVERTWNQCESEAELIANSVVFAQLFDKIEKLIQTCHKMDIANETVLSEAGVARLLESLLDVVLQEVEDADTLDRISAKLFDIASIYMKKEE